VGGEAWKYKNIKRKSDRIDARKLSVLSAMDQIDRVHTSRLGVRQWRGLIGYRQALVGERTRIRNRLRARLSELGMGWPGGKSGWTKCSVEAFSKLGLAWEKCSMEGLWRGQVQVELERLSELEGHIEQVELALESVARKDKRVALLQTIPGVGPRLSEMIVAIIDDPHRFKSGREVGSYAGLTPRRLQSGGDGPSGPNQRCRQRFVACVIGGSVVAGSAL
jgi:transposase